MWCASEDWRAAKKRHAESLEGRGEVGEPWMSGVEVTSGVRRCGLLTMVPSSGVVVVLFSSLGSACGGVWPPIWLAQVKRVNISSGRVGAVAKRWVFFVVHESPMLLEPHANECL